MNIPQDDEPYDENDFKLYPVDDYIPTEAEMSELREVVKEERNKARFEQWLKKNGMTLQKIKPIKL